MSCDKLNGLRTSLWLRYDKDIKPRAISLEWVAHSTKHKSSSFPVFEFSFCSPPLNCRWKGKTHLLNKRRLIAKGREEKFSFVNVNTTRQFECRFMHKVSRLMSKVLHCIWIAATFRSEKLSWHDTVSIHERTSMLQSRTRTEQEMTSFFFRWGEVTGKKYLLCE